MKNLVQKLTERWVGLRMAHEATMLEDAKELLRQQRSRVDLHQRKLLELPSTSPANEPEDAVHIGDVIHQAVPVAAKAAAVATGNAWLVPVLSALAAGGIGTGAAAWLTRPNGSPPPAAAAKPEPVELRVKWWVEDGQVKTQVSPVEKQ